MAASSNVLREYLISLGYSVDQVQQRKFDLNLLRTDKSAFGLRTSLLGVAAAANAAMVAYARSMERMYYSSIKADTSVSRLQQLDYGFRNIGLTGEDAKAAIEGFARSLRTNPGLLALVEALGVKTSGRDKGDVLLDLVDKLRTMPFFIGSQFAQMFGIDPDTFLLLSKGVDKLREAAQLRKEMADTMGLDMDRGAAAMKEYANLTRELSERLSVLGQVIAVEFLPYFANATYAMNRFFEVASRKVSEDGILAAIAKYTPGGLMSSMTSGPGRSLGSFLEKWWRPGAFQQFMTRKDFPHIPYNNVMGGRGDDINPPFALSGSTMPSGSGLLPLGIRNNNPGNLRSWGNAARSGGFATFGSAVEGLSALIGNLQAYQRRGLTTVEQIINRWAPPSENNTQAYVDSVAKALGVSAGAKLDLNDPKIIQALAGAIVKHENGYNPYTSSDMAAAMAARGITIHQNTEIKVLGNESPESTARAVGREQARVTSDVVRNLRSNVQ